MKRKVLIAALATVLGMGAMASNSYADGKRCHQGGKQMKSERFVERMQKKLDLSDEQTSQIKQLMSSQQESRQEHHENMRSIRTSMRALDPNAPDYQANVDKLVDQAAKNTAEMMRLKADKQKKMAEILTPEQQEKAKEMQKRFAEKRHHDKG